MRFYIDRRQRQFDDQYLSRTQGPALVVFNDAKFTEEDWDGIQRLQDSIKSEDPFSVGKFGIGVNSVFHITGKWSTCNMYYNDL